MNSFVIDANVAAKWYVEELGTKEAVAYRGQRLRCPGPGRIACGDPATSLGNGGGA